MMVSFPDLLETWRSRIHPAATREQVAGAFALLAGGAVLAVLGVLVVTLGDFLLPRPSWIREVGFVAAAGGLAWFLVGFVVALPARLWLRALSATGLVVAWTGIAIFAFLYPDRWLLTAQAPNVYAIGAYLGGASMLAAAASGAVASYFIERATPAGEAASERAVTDEEIAADLAWAEEQGWSWGGIREGRPDVSIRLKNETGPIRFKGRGKRVHKEMEAAQPEIAAVEALASLRGRKKDSTDSDVADQVSYLRELKQRKAAEEAAQRESWAWRLAHPIEWLKG